MQRLTEHIGQRAKSITHNPSQQSQTCHGARVQYTYIIYKRDKRETVSSRNNIQESGNPTYTVALTY